jgi:hypothetical protein
MKRARKTQKRQSEMGREKGIDIDKESERDREIEII